MPRWTILTERFGDSKEIFKAGLRLNEENLN
jgi:hypothetical protein